MKKVVIIVCVVIAVGVVVVVGLGLVASLAVPGLERARQTGNEASAIGSLRAITSAQSIYTATCGGVDFYSPSLSNLGTAPTSGGMSFISPDLGAADSVTKSGYVIAMGSTTGPAADAPASCNGLAAGRGTKGYYATATPASAEMGTRAFAVNADGKIWFAEQTTPIRVADHGQPAGAAELK